MNQASKKLTQAGKLAIAYQHFLYVPQEKIDAFNEKLYKDTLREDKNARQYKRLIDIPLDHYPEVPPDFVLDKIERALDIGCFDHLEVTKVDWIKEVKDPIVFGRINGSSDRFFIAQWDDDIKVEDLLLANFKEE